MAFLLPMILLLGAALLWAVVRRIRRRRAAADDVIYLGYDDQDNVDSMRAAMLDKARRGDLPMRD